MGWTKRLLAPILIRVTGPLLYALYRSWCWTIRYTEINRTAFEQYTDNGKPVVFCLWHDEFFPLIYLKKNLEIAVLVSQSQDGDIVTGVLERMGLKTARGSSSRGGLKALLSLIRRMKTERINACITIDGPRGPRHEVKEGAVFLAHKGKVPVVALRLVMSKAIRFRSWDRFQLPLPFSRVTMHCSDPYLIASDIRDSAMLEKECCRLASIMEGLVAPESDVQQ